MLMQLVPTIYWYQPQKMESKTQHQEHQQALQASGFNVQVITQAVELYQAGTEALVTLNTQHPSIFIISGDSHDSVAVIARLRAQHALLPIVTEFAEFNEQQIIHALYCGADRYCVQTNGTDLWIAAISSLLRRFRASESRLEVATAAVPMSQVEKTWVVADEGWLLFSPEGEKLALTTTERQLVNALCHQPDKRASHQHLLDAISNGDESEDMAVAHNRLGVVVSRLKRKAQSQGIQVPIRSVYKWGYMFGAAVRVD